MKLTKQQAHALHRVNGWTAPYWWNQGSMKKLAALGLVEPWHPKGKAVKRMAHRITDAGRKALKEMEGKP